MQRPFHHTKPPLWLGQATAGLLSASVAVTALVWVASSKDLSYGETGDPVAPARHVPRSPELAPAPHAVLPGPGARHGFHSEHFRGYRVTQVVPRRRAHHPRTGR